MILSTKLDNKVVCFGLLICVFHLYNVINKFWLILTNLKYDNLDKIWSFICFLEKLTKTLGKKMSKEIEKSPVKWKISTREMAWQSSAMKVTY